MTSFLPHHLSIAQFSSWSKACYVGLRSTHPSCDCFGLTRSAWLEIFFGSALGSFITAVWSIQLTSLTTATHHSTDLSIQSPISIHPLNFYPSVRHSVHLSIHPPPIHPHIHPPTLIHLSPAHTPTLIHAYIHPPTHQFISCPSAHPSIHPPIYLLPIHPSSKPACQPAITPPMHPSFHPFIHPSISFPSDLFAQVPAKQILASIIYDWLLAFFTLYADSIGLFQLGLLWGGWSLGHLRNSLSSSVHFVVRSH